MKLAKTKTLKTCPFDYFKQAVNKLRQEFKDQAIDTIEGIKLVAFVSNHSALFAFSLDPSLSDCDGFTINAHLEIALPPTLKIRNRFCSLLFKYDCFDYYDQLTFDDAVSILSELEQEAVIIYNHLFPASKTPLRIHDPRTCINSSPCTDPACR